MGLTALKLHAENEATQDKIGQDHQNQAYALMRADDALKRGQIAAGRLRMQAGQMVGTQRANYAASGVDANEGSAAEVQASTRGMGEFDALMAMNNAAREAWGLRTTAAQYAKQAQLDDTAGKQQEMGTLIGDAGTAAYAAVGK